MRILLFFLVAMVATMRIELIPAVSETATLSLKLRGQVNATSLIDRMVARLGIEPSSPESGSDVLPIDDRAKYD